MKVFEVDNPSTATIDIATVSESFIYRRIIDTQLHAYMYAPCIFPIKIVFSLLQEKLSTEDESVSKKAWD